MSFSKEAFFFFGGKMIFHVFLSIKNIFVSTEIYFTFDLSKMYCNEINKV